MIQLHCRHQYQYCNSTEAWYLMNIWSIWILGNVIRLIWVRRIEWSNRHFAISKIEEVRENLNLTIDFILTSNDNPNMTHDYNSIMNMNININIHPWIMKMKMNRHNQNQWRWSPTEQRHNVTTSQRMIPIPISENGPESFG